MKTILILMLCLVSSCAQVFSPTSSVTGGLEDNGHIHGTYANINGKQGVEITENVEIIYEGDLKSIQQAMQKDVSAKQGTKVEGK